MFGNDYPTPDGTGVRDYIHVMDLASGHVAALGRLLGSDALEHSVVNLGTGRGQSVLEVVRAFETASGRSIPYDVVERRAGDVAVSYADAGLAQRFLAGKLRADPTRCAPMRGGGNLPIRGGMRPERPMQRYEPATTT